MCYHIHPPTDQNLLEDPIQAGSLLGLTEKTLHQSVDNFCMEQVWSERKAALRNVSVDKEVIKHRHTLNKVTTFTSDNEI